MESGLIAIVDDDDAVRDSIGTLLEAHGFDVECYASGVDFLESEVRPNVACLVLDFHMPVMTGIDLLQELRRRGASCPTVLITGHRDPIIREMAAAEGVLEILEKPSSDLVLVGAVRRAIGKPAA